MLFYGEIKDVLPSGHEYGGQTVGLLGQILYSGSKDCSLRSWDLKSGSTLQQVTDHRDYIQSICVRNSPDGDGLVVTGGAADHLVIIYDTNEAGCLKCRHKLSGLLSVWSLFYCRN